MGKITYEEALDKVPKVFARLDKGQEKEIEYLRGSRPDSTFLRNLVVLSSHIWSVDAENFIALMGLQTTGLFTYNCWLMSTEGLDKNIRKVLRGIQEFEKYLQNTLGYSKYVATANIPDWFTPGIKLAKQIGFEEVGSLLLRAI